MVGQDLQWEYCHLFFVGVRISQGRRAAPDDAAAAEIHYYMRVVYMGPDGMCVERQLAAYDQTFTENPSYQAIGRLGGAGWEMVSMEPARDNSWTDDNGRDIVPYQAGVRPLSRAGYFKRPVVAGRTVEDPPLTLEAGSQ